jgi:hypothetical protein
MNAFQESHPSGGPANLVSMPIGPLVRPRTKPAADADADAARP